MSLSILTSITLTLFNSLALSQPTLDCLRNNNNCVQSFDGCNGCECVSGRDFPICTLQVCSDNQLQPPKCFECANNLIFDPSPRDACWRQKTCDNRDGIKCRRKSVPECRCPDCAPFWDENTLTCLTEKQCDKLDDDDDDDDEPPIPPTCPNLCTNYFDGCNTCFCNDGDGFGACTKRGCPDNSIKEPFCNECVNNLVFGQVCDACWQQKTCDNRLGAEACIQVCIPQCQCPLNAPFWDFETKSCLTAKECDALEEPPIKPTCPEFCTNYFDGCNNCFCSKDGAIGGCTRRACQIDQLEKPFCNQCINNLVFEDEKCDACWQEKTCKNRNGAEICVLGCAPQCQCPPNAPFWDEDTLSCLTDKECDELEDNDDEEPVLDCPELCLSFFDGCNTCSCNNGDGIGFCTLRACFIDELEDAKCNNCINNLVFEDERCDACWQERTCDNRDGAEICILGCAPQCQCPPDSPFWDEESLSCLTDKQCDELEEGGEEEEEILDCPELCIDYFDGCNDCTCNEGDGIGSCTEKFCFRLEEPVCNQCINNLEFDEEGCDACWQSRTCDNRDGAEICILGCFPGCQCPEYAPFWDEETLSCLTEKECDELDNDSDDDDDDDDDDEGDCPDLCINYFDGCNTCSCRDGNGFGICTDRACDENELKKEKCNDCINNLVWNKNGNKCWKERTCDNKRGGKSKECRMDRGPQCQCPKHKPFWNEKTQSCLSKKECRKYYNWY